MFLKDRFILLSWDFKKCIDIRMVVSEGDETLNEYQEKKRQ